MHMFRKLSAQAIACVVLSSHVIAVDGSPEPAQPQTPPQTPPRTPQHRLTPPSPLPASPFRNMSDGTFQNWINANREWLIDGRRVIFCDLEAVPTIGGPITEATFIATRHGEVTDEEVRHYYFNPETKVKHPKVQKIDPIDPRKQPTFAQAGSEIYEFIKDATLVTYGSFDARKLMEHFSYLPPHGKVYEITYVDALTMAKNDHARELGLPVKDTPKKKVSVTSKPIDKVKEEQAKRRKANREEKKRREHEKDEKRTQAKQQGKASPQPKKRQSKFGKLKFGQKEVAERYGVDDKFGAASVGLDPVEAYKRGKVPPSHQGKDHHSFNDTLKLMGISVVLAQQTIKARIDKARIHKARIHKARIDKARIDKARIDKARIDKDLLDEDSDEMPSPRNKRERPLEEDLDMGKENLQDGSLKDEDPRDDFQIFSPITKRTKLPM